VLDFDSLEREALAGTLATVLARRRLLDFARLVYPGFETPPHIRLLADLLERVERGELKKLMINIPVRHGKSTIASQAFPAWYLGRHPERDVIVASHSEDLAVRNSRVAKSLTQDQRWPFPDVRLASDSTSVQRWNTTARGGCYAIGVGGAVTGRGANLLIVDDALHDGLSEAECASAWRWYSEVVVPRLEPGGATIMIGARFSEQDLCGQILASEDGKNWTVVNLPAIAEDRDPLGRAPGEALWPERFSLAELEERRVSMGSRAFESQFQQRPVPAGGAMFKHDWFSNRYAGGLPRRQIVENTGAEFMPGVFMETVTRDAPLHKILAVDCASKTGIHNDYSALVTIASDEIDFFVVDVVRERLEFTDLVRRVIEVHKRFGHDAIYVEDASSGIQVVQELRRWTGLPIIPVTVDRSKVARAEAWTGFFEALRVRLPETAHWIDAYLTEFCSFPGGRHDDMVDATILGLTQMDRIIGSAQQSAVMFERLSGWIAR
jgi:predicted phage terminase large subunit-like protein